MNYDMDKENGFEATPERVTIYNTHPAYALLIHLRETEVALVQARAELAAWQDGYLQLGMRHDKEAVKRRLFETILGVFSRRGK